MRAYFYFDLVQQFGKIPLETKGNFEVRTDYKRAAVSDIYNQIISDLRVAEPLLPTKPSNGGKASRDAAAHLLAKVYLTRASAETEIRGMKPTDLDSCLYYAESVLPENGGTHKLMSNYADLWDMKNQGNSEVIYAVQFTNNPLYNDDGNWFHLYWNAAMYELQPGMIRDIANGRPYGMIRPTDKTLLTLSIVKTTLVSIRVSKWFFMRITKRHCLNGKLYPIMVKSILLPIPQKDKKRVRIKLS